MTLEHIAALSHAQDGAQASGEEEVEEGARNRRAGRRQRAEVSSCDDWHALGCWGLVGAAVPAVAEERQARMGRRTRQHMSTDDWIGNTGLLSRLTDLNRPHLLPTMMATTAVAHCHHSRCSLSAFISPLSAGIHQPLLRRVCQVGTHHAAPANIAPTRALLIRWRDPLHKLKAGQHARCHLNNVYNIIALLLILTGHKRRRHTSSSCSRSGLRHRRLRGQVPGCQTSSQAACQQVKAALAPQCHSCLRGGRRTILCRRRRCRCQVSKGHWVTGGRRG